jgi:hypothetical protein
MTRKMLAIAAIAAAVCSAQMRGGGFRGGGHRVFTPPPRPATGPIGHGFGNVVFPATGIPNSLYSHPTTFAQRLSATVSGYPGYGIGGRGLNRGRYGPQAGAYAIPVFVGGYGYDYGYAAQQPAPNITIVNAPPTQPSVIINQGYQPDQVRPAMRDYTSENLPEPGAPVQSYQAPIPSNPEGRRGQVRSVDDDKPTIYLVALQDGTVRSALAYWVEGDTVHYISTKYVKSTLPVNSVDVMVSEQLNSERGIDFHIPGRK